MSLVGLFKNNGWYFLDGLSNPSLFKDGNSRVINVMDTIKIEYDGSVYLGSFTTFTLNDVAASPYKMEYSLEFIVSSFGVDLQDVEGHVSRENNYLDNKVHIALQGSDIEFKTIFGLDTNELNTYFPIAEVPDPSLYDYSDKEAREEVEFFENKNEGGVVAIPEGVFRITRGWRDNEGHGGKCDFRTHTGTVYSATAGTVQVVKSSPYYGGSNYVIVESEFNGEQIYVRYFHLAYGSVRLRKGDTVEIGTVVGREGTDGGKYPQHCDFGARKVVGTNTNYLDCPVFEVSPILDNMWKTLHPKAEYDGTFEKDFKKLIAKHPSEHEITIS